VDVDLRDTDIEAFSLNPFDYIADYSPITQMAFLPMH